MKFPSIQEVSASLKRIKNQGLADWWAFPLDVRLQVDEDGAWRVHFGDSSFDTDHCGYWGAGQIDDEFTDLSELAYQLIDEAQFQFNCTQEGP